MTKPAESIKPVESTDPSYEPPSLSPLGSVHAQTLVTNPPQ